MNSLKIQSDYTANGAVYQLILPMDIADMIPVDDSVRLLDAAMERMNYNKLNVAYSHNGRIQISPKHFKALQAQENIVFVHGKAKRKSSVQRAIEMLEQYLVRQKCYDDYNHSFKDRNSFSKTDRDATFMRMKEDHMKNGQLKSGYNVIIAVDAEYIVETHISSDRSDSQAFIPIVEKLKGFLRGRSFLCFVMPFDMMKIAELQVFLDLF